MTERSSRNLVLTVSRVAKYRSDFGRKVDELLGISADEVGQMEVDNLNNVKNIHSYWWSQASHANVACSFDPLGNLTLKTGISSYVWDALSRMTQFNATTYAYRADGMRTKKAVNYNTTTTTYAYDGQMGIQDANYNTNTMAMTSYNDYAIGARGIDRWTIGASSVFFPIYDPHGNQVTYMSRVSGGSYWKQTSQRVFDPWGNIRNTPSGTDPRGRYCASLGHKSDDDDGMVYMRARYYDPAVGRFISEDPAGQGRNWYTYAENDPVNSEDFDGRDPLDILAALYILFLHMAPWAGSIVTFEPETLNRIHEVCELVDNSFERYNETQKEIDEALEPEGISEEGLSEDALVAADDSVAEADVLSIEMRVDFVIQFEQAELRIGLLIRVDMETEEL